MKNRDRFTKNKRYPLVFATIIAFTAVMSSAVSTFAWFQAEARVTVNATSTNASVSVSAPEGAKFYYFTGNGTPGGDYTGYSRSDSAIGQAPRVGFGTGSTTPSNVQFAEANNKFWFRQIDLSSNSTNSGVASPKNCFNFSKIRPGCIYSFCVSYKGTGVGLKLTFADQTTGNNTTPKRKAYHASTPYFLSLGVALNGHCSNVSTQDNAATYIKNVLTATASNTNQNAAGDKIVYPESNTLSAFTFASGLNTLSSNYIYFSVYMGFQDKFDAVGYRSKTGTGANEVITYNRGDTNGSYAPLEGLVMKLNKVEVTL